VTNGQVNRTGTGKLAWRFTVILGSKPLWETGEMGRRGHEKQMTKNRETLKKKTTLPHLPPPCIHDRHTERQRVRHSLPTKEDRTPQDKVGAGTTPCPPHSAVTTVLLRFTLHQFKTTSQRWVQQLPPLEVSQGHVAGSI
jgi:hypothetical protein